MIEVRAFIAEFSMVGQNEITMCKSFWNIKLFLIFFCQFDTVPFSVGLGVFSQIHSNVKDGSSDGAHQFSLWELLLKMEAAQNAFRGAGLIVLNEIHVKSCLFHVFLIVCFHKISAAVAVDGRGDDAESFNTADIFFYSDLSHIHRSPFTIIVTLKFQLHEITVERIFPVRERRESICGQLGSVQAAVKGSAGF